MYHETLNSLVKAHSSKGDVAVVYRLFPLDQLHPTARKDAEAFECANEVGGADSFWKYADALFTYTPTNNQSDSAKLYNLASQINLDSQKFKACLDSGKFASKISESVASANSAGAVGTPYTVINVGDEFLPLVDNNGNGIGAIPLEPLERILTGLSKR
jgi:protein-disulfide isomerase